MADFSLNYYYGESFDFLATYKDANGDPMYLSEAVISARLGELSLDNGLVMAGDSDLANGFIHLVADADTCIKSFKAGASVPFYIKIVNDKYPDPADSRIYFTAQVNWKRKGLDDK